MPTVTLNAKTAAAFTCPRGASEIVYWSDDLPGFGLRCRSSGARSWFVQYRTKAGELRKHTLGAPARKSGAGVTFAAARAEADRLIAVVKLGGDPAGDTKQAKAAAKAAITVGELVNRYLMHQKSRMRERSYEELRRHLGGARDGVKSRPRHARPLDATPIHKHAASRVTQRMAVELLQDLALVAPTTANRVRANLSAMFAWGMKAGIVSANPIAATFKPAEEKPRERVLADGELALIWSCTAGGADHDRIVRLLMLTGARREEIAAMRWSEITMNDDGTVVWLLPSGRSKNGLPHMLTLPRLTVAQLPSRRDGRDLLFGEREGAFSGWSRCKERLDDRIANAKGAPIAAWVLHDLRRTLVTRLNDLAVEPHVIEALVNHVGEIAKAGVAGVYNRSAYAPQKRAALALWCDHIGHLTGEPARDRSADVVQLRRAG
jgi:integrase